MEGNIGLARAGSAKDDKVLEQLFCRNPKFVLGLIVDYFSEMKYFFCLVFRWEREQGFGSKVA